MATAVVARSYLRSHKNSPEQRKLSRRKKSGRNRAKQKKVARLNAYLAQRKDFLRQQRGRIERYDAVCIEDLNMRGMAQSLNFQKSVSDKALECLGFLGYKLTKQGKFLDDL
jgi:putative transposase